MREWWRIVPGGGTRSARSELVKSGALKEPEFGGFGTLAATTDPREVRGMFIIEIGGEQPKKLIACCGAIAPDRKRTQHGPATEETVWFPMKGEKPRTELPRRWRAIRESRSGSRSETV